MRIASVLLLAAFALSGCAQVMAFRQPGHLTCREDILREGVERSLVVGCLGPPVTSDEHQVDDRSVMSDTYVYRDGGAKNHGASKAGRAVLYTAGDVFTLFLSQLIWMPAEALLLDATKRQASVEYERSGDGKWKAVTIAESEVGTR